MITAVLDTNVLASGFVNQAGTPGQILLHWTYEAFTLVVSEHILVELARTFDAPYFRRRLTPEQRAANLALLRSVARIAPVTADVRGVATHPEDDAVLATAVSGGAGYLVTGDHRVQELSIYRSVRILSSRTFLALLESD